MFGIRQRIYPITGCPSTLDHETDMVRALIATDFRWISQELSAEVGISHQTMWYILKNILTRGIASHWISHRLPRNIEMTSACTDWSPSQEIFQWKGEFLYRKIVINRIRAQVCEPELMRQLNEWHHSGSSRSPGQEPSRAIAMLIVICDYEDFILIMLCQPVKLSTPYCCRFIENYLHLTM